MKIPKKLKIGGHDFDVILKKPTDKEKGYNNWGKTFFANNEMMIDNDLSQSRQEEVFLHEILHCCFEMSGLNKELDDKKQKSEEDIICNLTAILYQILKDNNLLK